MKFVKVDTILRKVHSDYGMAISNMREDVIEWIGEALEYVMVKGMSKDIVDFIEVENYKSFIPGGLKKLVFMAVRVNDSFRNDLATIETPIGFTFQGFLASSYAQNFFPVRESSNPFFKVMNQATEGYQTVYEYIDDETSYVFNFKEGDVAIAYVGNRVDENGYPLVPDDIRGKDAITNYVMMKLVSREFNNHREGSVSKLQHYTNMWRTSLQAFTNNLKMPKNADDYQQILEESYQMINPHKRFYNFFENLGRMDMRGYIK